MRTENGQGASCTQLQAVAATEILHDITLSDEIKNMRQHLREMADYYLLETEDSSSYKHSVYSTYMILDNFLTKVEEYRKKEEVSQG